MATLYIAAGKVAAIGTAPTGWTANRDDRRRGPRRRARARSTSSARLREPGFEYKATLESEMDAAVAGGVTSLACPPDTDPPLDEPGLVEMLKHRARVAQPRARLSGRRADAWASKGETLTEMGELADAGCVAFSQADAPLADTQVLLRAMQYAATFGYRGLAARRRMRISRKGGVAHDGEVATRLGLAGDSRRPPRRSRSRRSSRWCARPARACTCAGCRRADGVAHGARGEDAKGCR